MTGGLFLRSRITFVLAVLLAAGAAQAEDAALDFSTWQQLPVFQNGRRMPLDTLARSIARSICGRENPTLSPPDEELSPAAAAKVGKLFPDGKPRKFTAAEILFSWLVEPDKWERVPMLVAEQKQLREEILGLPARDAQGRRLRHISPWQLERSGALHRRWQEIQNRPEGSKGDLKGVDLKVRELIEAQWFFRNLTFDPARPGGLSPRFDKHLVRVMADFKNLWQQIQSLDDEQRSRSVGAIGATMTAHQRLVLLRHGKKASLEQLDAATAALGDAVAQLQRELRGRGSPAIDVLLTELAAQAVELHLALYDNGLSLRLAPALSPAALEAKRPDDDDAQPWLSLQALLGGSEAALRGYPGIEVEEVRKAFGQSKNAYLDREDPDRAEHFSAEIDRLAEALAGLGGKLNRLRRELPFQDKNDDLLAATEYPPSGFTRLETAYNRFDPFLWSWVVGLGATLCLALSFGAIRKPMFWTGVSLLVAAQALSIGGLTLRMLITGLVPMTGMFETVVFAGLCVALLGLWFALLPLVWPGLKAAWRESAIPFTPEARPAGDCPNFRVSENGTVPFDASAGDAPSKSLADRWSVGNWLLLLPRAWLVYEVFDRLIVRTTSDGAMQGYIRLLPRLEADSLLAWITSQVGWLTGLCVLALAVYYVPRLATTIAAALLTVPYALAKGGLAAPLGQVFDRKAFALVAAVVALLAALAAYYAPTTILHKDIGSPMPVLRNNFWLFVHVGTITASYGAGALAWGLSNIALAYYLFGRYRTVGRTSSRPYDDFLPAGELEEEFQPHARLAPEPCAALAAFTYKATKVAVLMLAAGTILGALWADVAWGRFWGWDAKEVWSLVSLLAYLVILHGRYIGWFGNFGLAVGSVLGFTSIVMAWYGVNHVLGSGLHSYGSGAGGQVEIAIAVACNWLFVIAAAVRYNLEMRT